VGVSTTGVYCRPVCGVRTPGRDRCTFYPNAASAEAAGYRPCLRCRPELAPGQAPVDAVHRVARLAAARIDAGALNDGSLETLAAEFALGSRQLRRVIEQAFGVSPLALAQTRRLLLAKQLLTDSRLTVADVAFASGFSSLRQFNRVFRQHYRLNPLALRRQLAPAADTGIVLKLGYRPPLAWGPLVGFLASRGGSRLEASDGQRYLRTVTINGRSGWFCAQPLPARNQLQVEVAPTLIGVLPPLLARLRRLFDLDANPQVIDAHLQQDSHLGRLALHTPGLRVPGCVDGFELALRAVLGQQVTVKAATTLFNRFVDSFGFPVITPLAAVDRAAPSAESVAQASLQQLIDHGLTRRRADTILRLAQAIADGSLSLQGATPQAERRAALLAMPGIGPWTVEYISMRAFADPDGFPAADLGLMRALDLRKPNELQARAECWRPWRAYAALHLWHSLGAGG
jgi:AraC family transcriptional regulator of adaptative response / DNA-3-methyladenine glycosylase II